MTNRFTETGPGPNGMSIPNIESTADIRKNEESLLLANTLIQIGKKMVQQESDFENAKYWYDKLSEDYKTALAKNNAQHLDLQRMRMDAESTDKKHREVLNSLMKSIEAKQKEVDDWRDSYAKKSSEVDILNRRVQLLDNECDEYCEKLKFLRSELRKAKRKR